MTRHVLGYYKIFEKLGEGGMGEVYRARDTRLDRDVALKILPAELAVDPERRKRFEREAKAVAGLKHPNIVTLHSVEKSEGVHFITMELVEGETLSEIIPPDGLDLDRFFDIAIALADAISAAHAKGVAHRDLKPANIMFDADGRLKVLDFGLAKLMETTTENDDTVGADSNTAEGKVLGTAAYMSPEQAEGSPIDLRSDIFSLGVIFYEMITGRRPFEGKTTISTITQILRDEPPSLTDIKPLAPRHLGRIIKRCLAKDPDRRFQTAVDIRNDLQDLKDEVREHSGVTAVDSSTTDASGIRTPASDIRAAAPVPPPQNRGGKLGRYAIIGGIAVVAAVLLVTYFSGRKSPERVSGGTKRLAVLPFENLGSSDDEYFADGMTDEITAKLAGTPGLAVISRASARKYKNTDKGMQEVGSELGVDYILEGTIRWDKSGGREKVRITPQLINVADDSHLWASNYEREIDEIFAVQADIARQIAGALNVTLGGGESAASEAPTENVAAYQSYLRAMEYDEEDEQGIRNSIGLLERAVELDPSFAVAWAELAKNHSGMVHYGFDRSQERIVAAKQAVERARALGPDLVDAYAAEGTYHYWVHRDYDRALEALDYGEQLNPNDYRVLSMKAFVLRRQARLEESLDYMERALELNPQYAVLCRDISFTLQLLRRHDEAIPYYERAINISPDFWNTYVLAAWCYVMMGDIRAAQRTLARTPNQHVDEFEMETLNLKYVMRENDALIAAGERRPEEMLWLQNSALPFGYWVARGYQRKGDTEAAREYFEGALTRLREEIELRPDDHRLHSAIGRTYAALGMREEAIRHGQRGMELMTVAKDLMQGADRIMDMSVIYAEVGEPELALEHIEQLLDMPADFTANYVRLYPGYDTIRSHPRYEEVLSRFESKM